MYELPPTSFQNLQTDFKEMYFNLLKEFNDYKKEHENCCQNKNFNEIDEINSEVMNLRKEVYEGKPQYFSLNNFKEHKNKFQYYTGFPDYETFELSLDILFGVDRQYAMKRKYCDNGSKLKKLHYKDEYFLVLIKLRHDYGYEHLATLFNLSCSTVCAIFSCWINHMFIKFGNFDIWPHRNILFENYSIEFKKKYPNVIGSMNATEFFIQTPSSLVKQSQTYSQYNRHNTIKGLIIVDGNGVIIFTSPLFTGSISSKKLVQDCGLLKIMESKINKGYLNEGDTFLADEGFTVQDLLNNNNNINVNIPVFQITGGQFSADDVNHIRMIVTEAIHVEKAFSRIKQYKVLSNTVPISLIGSFNQIWTVCCVLSNFQNPLRQ